MKNIKDTLAEIVGILNDPTSTSPVRDKIMERVARYEQVPFLGVPDWLQRIEDVPKWIDAMPIRQFKGKAGPTTASGDVYEEFHQWAYARPGDVAVIECELARHLACRIARYLVDHYRDGHAIYWRRPFEGGACPTELSHDKDWVLVTVYARLCCCAPPKMDA